ncbi:unnamed protein product [Dicrocoelium dendriticum]|nr:unnamed protein product [Dicrocoelium dendriticum]
MPSTCLLILSLRTPRCHPTPECFADNVDQVLESASDLQTEEVSLPELDGSKCGLVHTIFQTERNSYCHPRCRRFKKAVLAFAIRELTSIFMLPSLLMQQPR